MKDCLNQLLSPNQSAITCISTETSAQGTSLTCSNRPKTHKTQSSAKALLSPVPQCEAMYCVFTTGLQEYKVCARNDKELFNSYCHGMHCTECHLHF